MTESRTILLKDGADTALVYLDPFSTRIRVDEYLGSPESVLKLVGGTVQPWVEKIILKSRPADREIFLSAGFKEEALVRGYFKGEDMHFLVRYTDPDREQAGELRNLEDQIRTMVASAVKEREPAINLVSPAGYGDAEELSAVFRSVFQLYPTPVDDPTYIRKTMQEGTRYYGVRSEGRLQSVGSAEVNSRWLNAELTDCATITEAAGKGYMYAIMAHIDRDLLRQGVRCRYSIARASSYPMNVIFHRLGYSYSGCLRRNVRIGTGLEDMNVWCRFDP